MRKIPLVFTALCLVLLCFGAAANASAAALKTYKNSIGMEFMLIPAGSFMMGIDPNDETPQHNVTISKPFYLGKYEVTQAQWVAVMGSNPSNFEGRTNPVEQVSWDDAQEFIRRLNQMEGPQRYRLPTEAEWEYATRAGTGSVYSFGDDGQKLSEYAWYGGNSGHTTHPVGQKQPNPWGLHDVHGNVYEWVQDWYGEKYYANSPGSDPKGPTNGSKRVNRGGCWADNSENTHSGSWNSDHPSYRTNYIGFRLALSPEAPYREVPFCVIFDPSPAIESSVHDLLVLFGESDLAASKATMDVRKKELDVMVQDVQDLRAKGQATSKDKEVQIEQAARNYYRDMESLEVKIVEALLGKHKNSLELVLSEAMRQISRERGYSLVVAGKIDFSDGGETLTIRKASDFSRLEEVFGQRLAQIARTGNMPKKHAFSSGESGNANTKVALFHFNTVQEIWAREIIEPEFEKVKKEAESLKVRFEKLNNDKLLSEKEKKSKAQDIRIAFKALEDRHAEYVKDTMDQCARFTTLAVYEYIKQKQYDIIIGGLEGFLFAVPVESGFTINNDADALAANIAQKSFEMRRARIGMKGE